MSQRGSGKDGWKLDEAAFERQLLGAAAHDAPPAAASERAFRALAADASALAGLTALTASRPAATPARAPAIQPPIWAGLLLGALLGGGVVALWLQLADHSVPLVPPLPPRPVPPQLIPELATAELEPRREAPTPAARERELVPHAPGRRPRERSAEERASRLAREVAMLDAARAALAVGAADGTLRQLQRYRAEFPDGELSADAEAVAIEALAAQGDHAALALAAQRFLARHPRDPHAARVRELAFIEPPSPPPPSPVGPVPVP